MPQSIGNSTPEQVRRPYPHYLTVENKVSAFVLFVRSVTATLPRLHGLRHLDAGFEDVDLRECLASEKSSMDRNTNEIEMARQSAELIQVNEPVRAGKRGTSHCSQPSAAIFAGRPRRSQGTPCLRDGGGVNLRTRGEFPVLFA
jgi:hypothetical protein